MKGESMRKIYISASILIILLVTVIVRSTDVSADIGGSFRVVDVVGPDKVKISFYGLPVVVRLANLKPLPEAEKTLETLISSRKVTITYADELGTDDSDVPYVYMGVGPAMSRKFVNIELIKQGLADYDCSKAHSKRYDKRFTSALAKAKKARLGIWSNKHAAETGTGGSAVLADTASVPAGNDISRPKKGKVISELNSRFYHLPTCPYAERLSERRLIRYASFKAAERAGKRPCRRCLRQRAGKFGSMADGAAKGRRRWPGKLIGLKSDPTYFYSPVSPKLKKVDESDMIGFDTLKEAKASGRKPDPISLRLTSLPGYPSEPPAPGECIGRALPYFRPCRRAPADESGLCLECQRGE